MLDRTERRCAGAAVVTADKYDVRIRLGDARRDRADARFGDEFDADLRPRIDLLEVVDQLGQVFDAVNVVMRRR